MAGKEMTKIFEILKVEQLDESAREDVAKYLSEVVELKAKERAVELSEGVLAEEKERLTEEYAAKFEEYKDDISDKWSGFVEKVIEEEVQIPDSVKQFAALGETYQPLLEAIRTQLAVSEGSVDEEAKALLREAKEEIVSLRSDVNRLMSENMTLTEDAKAMATHIYLRKKCDGLTEAQKTTVMTMLSDLTDVKAINEKFEFVLENILNEKKKGKKKDEEDEDDDDWDDDENDEDKPKKKGKKDKDKEGKGKVEVVKESSDGWKRLLESYKNTNIMKVLP